MLHAAVGDGGANQPDDVRLVQTLLNDRQGPSGQALRVDGQCGPVTIAAIRRFQAQILGLSQQDGLVAPDGPTARALAPVTPRLPAEIPPEQLPADIVQAAQAAQRAYGVPACISLAQWILESGRGAHTPPGSNNPFGIKAAGYQPYVLARTREVIDGKSIYIDARFRKFPSIADAFAEHARLLANFPPYRPAMRCTADPDLFAAALTGVYATDPSYGSALQAIMRGSNLYTYNVSA